MTESINTIDLTKKKMNECPSLPDSAGTQKTTVRSMKSVSQRSKRGSAQSYGSRKSNRTSQRNVCTNDFVVVGGVGLDSIDINFPKQKQR